MSSSGGAGGGAAQRYFCHQCDRTVTLTPSSDLACPICHGGFVEELETPPSESNPSPNPFISFHGPFSPAQTPFFFPASSSGGPTPAAATAVNLEGLFGGGSRPTRTSGAADDVDALNSTLQYVLSRLQDLTAGGAHIQFVIENHPSGNFGDYFVGPGLEQLIQQLAENDPNRYGTPPASKSAVESLPEIKVTEELLASDEAQCAVCKDTFGVGTDAKQMPCKHIYHKDCILPWLELHNSCPSCRHELPTDDPDYEHRMRGTPPPSVNRFGADENNTARGGSGAGTVPEEGSSPGAGSRERNTRISVPVSIRTLFGMGNSGRNGGNNDSSSGAGDTSSNGRGSQDRGSQS